MKTIRIMTWNLMEGAHVPARTGSAPKIDPIRLSAAQALVARVAPDILVLNEALWCEPVQGYAFDYAGAFGFKHMATSLYDGPWGNAVLSRFPFVRVDAFRIYNRSGLITAIAAPGPEHAPLQVATYHPHPSRYPHHKAADFQAVLDGMDPNLPLVITGDFNAICPSDGVDRLALARAFAAFSRSPETDSARFIDGGEAVFPVLQKHGLHDALAGCAMPTMPTALLGGSAADSGMRIDHVWVNGHLSVRRSEVLMCDEADKASDHYPLCVDLALHAL